jgi:hypothetical protein
MALDLANYEVKAREAVKAFWGGRDAAALKQAASGKVDQGARGSVTAGKNMDRFIDLVSDLVHANGFARAKIHRKKSVLTLPGYFRPTKLWDVLIMEEGRLIAALEFKSQVGPSFGNNCNNRAEEAIGTGHDFWTAYREGAFGKIAKPFVGWLMLVEDAPESRSRVENEQPHFPVFKEFQNASYLDRYNILCQKLVTEQIYTSAALLASARSNAADGGFTALEEMTSLKTFITCFAGHVAGVAASMA